jgi:hypothetical protein
MSTQLSRLKGSEPFKERTIHVPPTSPGFFVPPLIMVDKVL